MTERMKGQARLRLATKDGKLLGSFARSGLYRRLRSMRMHSQQVVSADALALPVGGVNHSGPRVLGNSLPLLPLCDGPNGFADIGGHVGHRGPKGKQLLDGHDTLKNTRDSLSRQGGTRPPVTRPKRVGTMCPVMGSRATTPKEFREAFARRLRAARELKYERASDFAADLGIPPNTYSKYENGRSLLPHHLIPRACELLGIEIRQLFEFERKAARKIA